MIKSNGISKALCFVAITIFIVMVLCPVHQANADNDLSAASPYSFETNSSTESMDLSDGKFFVAGDDLVSAINATGKIATSLQANDEKVNSVDYVSDNLFLVNAETDGDVIATARNIVDDSNLDARIFPVRKYKTYRSEYSRETYAHLYSQVYQAETFGNATTEDGGAMGVDNFNGSSTMKTYYMAEDTGRTATIAVVDSGVRTTHKLIKDMVLEDLAYNAFTGEKGGQAVTDDADHGTGVASIIVSNPYYEIVPYGRYRTGVCANTKVLPVKVADDNGESDDVSIIKGLDYIESLVKERKVTDLHVINLSIGCLVDAEDWNNEGYGRIETDPLYAKIRHLQDAYDIKCVCAAGNELDNGIFGTGRDYTVPADYDCCVSVMASSTVNALAYFSNSGPEKDLIAPGDNLEAASSKTDKAYFETVSGTSYSSPIVAGALSSLIQIDPSLSTNDAQKLLEESATPMTLGIDNQTSVPDGCAGHGMVNAEKAAWFNEKKKHKMTSYWDGMSDGVEINGILYGFKVLSASGKTAAVTSITGTDKVVKTITFPDRVRLNDGNWYKVVSIQVPYFCNALAANAYEADVKTNLIIGPNISRIVRYSGHSVKDVLEDLIIKSTYITPSTFNMYSFLSVPKVRNIIVDTGKDHAQNRAVYDVLMGTLNKKKSGLKKYESLKMATDPIKLAKASVVIEESAIRYTGKKVEPKFSVMLSGKKLKAGRDYSVLYENNVAAGTASVTINGIGNYDGIVKSKFKIKKTSISNSKIMGVESKTYTGEHLIQEGFKVKLGTVMLKDGEDYMVSYKHNVKAGISTMIISGKGSCYGHIAKTFKIKKSSISQAKLTNIDNKIYTGKKQVQKPVIKLGTTTLKKGHDYTVSYKHNVKVGTATMIVVGKGNYSGRITKTFKIKNPGRTRQNYSTSSFSVAY